MTISSQRTDSMTTNRTHLTLERIRKLSAPDGKQATYTFDDSPQQLSVRITPAGAKSFVYCGKIARAPIRITIGSVDIWNLEDARDEARRLQCLVDQDIDPRIQAAERLATLEAKREERRRSEIPALNAWQDYLEARKGKWSARTLLDHQRLAAVGGKPKTRGRRKGEGNTTQPGILMPLLQLPLNKINATQTRQWLRDEAKRRPTQANNAFVRLRTFLNWCSEQANYRSQVHSDACSSKMARDELPKRKAKDDCLQREQLPAWFAKVKSISNPGIAAYLQITLLTGARREEIASLNWTDIDFQWKTISIRDKVDGNRLIPMTPYVQFLLEDLKRRNQIPPPQHRILDGKRIENDLKGWKPSEWVFSSKKAASGRLQDPSIQHRAVCTAAGIDGLTIHGLRRSFGTLSEWVECPTGVVAQIMGHKPSAIAEKHYRRRPIDLLRLWHSKIETWILEQAGIEQPRDVYHANSREKT